MRVVYQNDPASSVNSVATTNRRITAHIGLGTRRPLSCVILPINDDYRNNLDKLSREHNVCNAAL